jgi:hypothetical protein
MRLTPLCRFAVAIVCFALPHASDAQLEIGEWPDPGYRKLGVYGGGPDSYFDYRLAKLSLGETFPNKKSYWAGLKANDESRTEPQRPTIFLVYCGERSETYETCRARVDAWLKPEPGIPTYPELIPAICLGEENVGKRDPVLDRLARHVRESYGIPVFQFYSMPLSPNPNLTADGWLFDAYGMQEVTFRKHLMKFVALGKPVVCIPWASDPHWPGWTRSANTEAMVNREWHQFSTCMEFEVSCAVFAVAGPGAINPWLNSRTPHMIKLRNWLRTKREQMHAMDPCDLPLATADFSARDRSVSAGGNANSPSVYEESFSGFAWIHDADIRGFLHLQLTSLPEETGFLRLRPNRFIAAHERAGVATKPAHASLTWRFESYFPLDSVRVTLDAAAPSEAECRNVLAVTADELGKKWLDQVEQSGTDDIQPVVLDVPEALRNHHAFYVRLDMRNAAVRHDQATNLIDRLRVECVHQAPEGDATAKLVSDDYGNFSYEDDFTTNRWTHLGYAKVGHKNYGGHRGTEFWVGMVGGYATSTELLQRFSSPRPMTELVITADCYADGSNLGGKAVLQVSTRGADPKWEVATSGLHRGALKLEIPPAELGDLREFDVRVLLRSNSGVEHGSKACATLRSLTVNGK